MPDQNRGDVVREELPGRIEDMLFDTDIDYEEEKRMVEREMARRWLSNRTTGESS